MNLFYNVSLYLETDAFTYNNDELKIAVLLKLYFNITIVIK